MRMVGKYYLAILALCATTLSFAGNEDRAGTAGAGQLLINPSARSSAWGSSGVSSAVGLDAMYLNVAGLAFTQQTEIMFARTSWMSGADINVNLLGFTQHVGAAGVVGFSVMTIGYGDIAIRTTELPEGGIGNFSPTNSNLRPSPIPEPSYADYPSTSPDFSRIQQM